MKCCDVEPLLDQLVRLPGDERGTDRSAVQDHLATCPSCQSSLRSLARWDRQLTEAMNDIPVPAGLSQQLLAAMNPPASTDSVPKPAAIRNSPLTAARRRIRLATGLAVCCLLAVAAVGIWHVMQPPLVSPGDIAMLLQQPVEQLDTSEDSRAVLPGQWAALGRKVKIQGWKQAELRSHRLAVAVIQLVQPKRVPAVTGSLIVIPRSRWKPRAMEPASQAPVQYSPPHVWISWAEGDLVYILTVNGPAPILEQLQRQLDGNNAVL